MTSASARFPTPPPDQAPKASSMDFDIVSHYNKLLRADNEITKPVAAIESLIALLDASPPSTVSETLTLIEAHSKTLESSIPNATALSAGTDLFQRYIISALQSGEQEDFGAVRSHLLANSKLFAQRAKEARGSIARIAKRFIDDGTTVLTCGSSRVVGAVLNAAADEGIAFRLIYLQSDTDRVPASIAQLRTKDIPVAINSFATLGSCISKTNFVLVGAESVVENGGVVSSMGTKQVGLLARSAGKSFYVVAESHKFVRMFPLAPEDLGIEADVLDFRTSENDKDQSQYSIPLDFTTPGLITAIVTEAGVQTPSAVSEELIKMWY